MAEHGSSLDLLAFLWHWACERCCRPEKFVVIKQWAPITFQWQEDGPTLKLRTARMGVDPKRSAVNSFCQSHEVKNLFVVDGAVFPTCSEKNPTLTILALAWRATDYLAEELRAGARAEVPWFQQEDVNRVGAAVSGS